MASIDWGRATRYFLMARPVGEKEIVYKRKEFNPLDD